MKVRITHRLKRFDITFEWDAKTEGQSESEFDLECSKMIWKLVQLGRSLEPLEV